MMTSLRCGYFVIIPLILKGGESSWRALRFHNSRTKTGSQKFFFAAEIKF